MSDSRLARARRLHVDAQRVEQRARLLRVERNMLVIKLHRDGVSYSRIAKELQCSPELIAKICRSLTWTVGVSDRD